MLGHLCWRFCLRTRRLRERHVPLLRQEIVEGNFLSKGRVLLLHMLIQWRMVSRRLLLGLLLLLHPLLSLKLALELLLLPLELPLHLHLLGLDPSLLLELPLLLQSLLFLELLLRLQLLRIRLLRLLLLLHELAHDGITPKERVQLRWLL